ncbi:MAG TPA: TssN family type VI secretion system protein [Puia sp.]|nr:TssN family type VI secretion system protein [Puia sp.]
MIHFQLNLFPLQFFFRKLIENRREAVVYSGTFVLISFVFGSLATMHNASSSFLHIVQLIAFFGLGCVNVVAIRSVSFLSKEYFLEYLYYTLLISLIICLFLWPIYYLTDSDSLMAFASSCAFLLPFAFVHMWFFYKHIPKDIRLMWNKEETEPDEVSLSFRGMVPVSFQLTRAYFDMQVLRFPVTVSAWVKIGVLFNQLLLEQNKDGGAGIELTDENHCPYGWEFYEEVLGGLVSRQLNPELNMKNNKIAPQSIIAVRRVKIK